MRATFKLGKATDTYHNGCITHMGELIKDVWPLDLAVFNIYEQLCPSGFDMKLSDTISIPFGK